MRLDVSPGICVVTLSRRNLRALLIKLDQPWSMRTVTSTNSYKDGGLVDGLCLVVMAQDDDAHYADREPGPMIPATEALLGWHDQADATQ